MAEKKKYNSILVSGRKDQTLTYSKYVKDEESGESVKESLDKKVNVTDELTTQQIKDGAITNEKMAADSVGNSNLQDGSVSNEKLEDGSITNEKLAENSITKDKLKDNTIGVEKLDPELRQTINAATGLPENLVETIQNVDDTLKKHQRQLDDKQQQITANDEDISLLQTRSTQMEETIKDIAATGGASQATAVTYNNEKSKLTAINIQSAVDEVVDKTAIKDEEEAVVETPFRYIQNEEFIFAKVDAEDKLLFGFQWDGTPVFGKTSAVEDRLQSQVNLLADKITTILGDDDTTSAIDTLKELKNFFASIDNTQTLTSILANLNNISTKLGEDIKNLQDTKVDKEEGKSLIEDEVKECFRVIENEEFIIGVVDSEDKVLFGIYRATGKPYYPQNDMYHISHSEEFLWVILDTANHPLLGIQQDGTCWAAKAQWLDDIKAIKEVLSSIDETLKTFQPKEDGKGLINVEVADSFFYISNDEYIIAVVDAENKVLGYRDSEGTRHEHKISANHLELSDEAAKDINEAFKSAGIKMENPSDFSKDSHIELPIPRIAAQVRIYAPKLPITKQDDIEAEIEYNDKDGNYFKKPVILNAQGSSSMSYYVKNMAIDINDDSEIKFGDFPTQDSFHLKKYYIDAFRGQCIVGYWLMEQVYKSRPLGQQYPYEYSYSNNSDIEGYGDVKKDFFNGAKCHPDGFPIIITWVNSKTEEETYMGIYTWNLKKSKEVYNCNKKTAENIILDGEIAADTLFGGTINWGAFEVRNPKSLIDINGNKYDGDNPKELSNTDKLSKTVKSYIQNLSGLGAAVKASDTKETYAKYLLINPTIDYMLLTQVTFHHDGLRKNWIWLTLNGKKWCPNAYDMDSIFGNHWNGTATIPHSDTINALDTGLYSFMKVYKEELSARYKELRDLKIFDANNIVGLLNKWLASVGYDNLKKEFEIYNETPSYRDSKLNSQWELADVNATQAAYSEITEYNEGNLCSYLGMTFRAKETVTGVPPLSGTYDKAPKVFGFYNSPQRVYNWLVKRIAFLDNYYSYK